MAIRDCIADIRAAAGADLDDADILRILEAVDRRRRARQAAGGLASTEEQLRAASAELADEERLAALIEKRSRALNLLAKGRRFARYDAAPGREARTLREINVGSERGGKLAARSADAERLGLEAKLVGGLIGELRRDGLLAVLRRRTIDFERRVAREIWRATGGGGEATGDGFAERAAAILVRHLETGRQLQNEAGAWIGQLRGYIVRQSHDSWRIGKAAGRGIRWGDARHFAAWRDFIVPKLDERTFLDVDDRDAFLRHVWVNLATGNHLKASGGGDWLGGFTGPGNLAKRLSAERVLHFKSADDWFDYNQRFGTRSLLHAVLRQQAHAARNTAVMRAWGTNPEAAFRADVEQLQIRAKDSGALDQVAKLGGWLRRAELDQATGAANIAENPTLAMVAQTARDLITMARLGGVVLSSLPDIAIRASALRHHGVGYLEAFSRGFSDLLEGRSPGDRREIADYLGAGIDGVLGGVWARFTAVDGVPGHAAKLMDAFFRANLLTWWTDALKRGAGLMLSRHLADNAGRAFAELAPDLQRSLARYGIEAGEWETLRRSAVRQAEDGRGYMTAEGIEDRDLELGLRAYFAETVNEAMTVAGGRERALLTLGEKPGTPAGEALRFFMQFKTFPVTFATRQIGRELNRAGGMDVPGLAALIAGTTGLGYLSLSSKEVSRGRAPRDPREQPVDTFFAAMQQGGGLGIYGDFLFGRYNRFGGGGAETLMGPAVGTLGEFLRAYGRATEGEAFEAGAVRATVNAFPFVNLFYTRMALDYLILYQMQEWMSPGYLRRFEQRIRRENNQTFILRPSEAIPRGGGGRLFEGLRE